MRTEKRDSNQDRRILTGMITNRSVLSRLSTYWDGVLFRQSWCNLIGQWCVDHFQRYDKAPGKEIEILFSDWAESAKDEKLIDLIADFLETLSDEYESGEEINADYILDLAGKRFNAVRLATLAEQIQDDLADNQIEVAQERITGWGKIELGKDGWIDPFNNMEAIREAFESKNEPLVVFPGALGEFFGDSLERDGFIGIMGPDKRGKSFWLCEIAFRALLQRRRVAFFEAGDMSQKQILRRIMSRVARQPQRNGQYDYPKDITRKPDERIAGVRYVSKTFDDPLAWQKAWAASQELMRKRVKSKKTLWRLACHPNSTLSVEGIRAILAEWERQDWIPDLVVIDYADILAPCNGRLDTRDQIDETWRRLRAMSQTLHCLVVTASQTDTPAYKTNIITRENFSGDKRKNAHVTGMIGLNQNPEEKDRGIIRLNWVVLREGAFSETKCVHVAGCPAMANPAVKSCW